MEFYLAFLLMIVGSLFVSIPNGMEFYLKELLNSYIVLSFNSQRDGILPSNYNSVDFR